MRLRFALEWAYTVIFTFSFRWAAFCNHLFPWYHIVGNVSIVMLLGSRLAECQLSASWVPTECQPCQCAQAIQLGFILRLCRKIGWKPWEDLHVGWYCCDVTGSSTCPPGWVAILVLRVPEWRAFMALLPLNLMNLTSRCHHLSVKFLTVVLSSEAGRECLMQEARVQG